MNCLIYFFELLILLVILEIFLDAVFLLTVPVLAIFINCEWNLGRKFLASFIFPELRYIVICLTADLYLLFLPLFTKACFFDFLMLV